MQSIISAIAIIIALTTGIYATAAGPSTSKASRYTLALVAVAAAAVAILEQAHKGQQNAEATLASLARDQQLAMESPLLLADLGHAIDVLLGGLCQSDSIRMLWNEIDSDLGMTDQYNHYDSDVSYRFSKPSLIASIRTGILADLQKEEARSALVDPRGPIIDMLDENRTSRFLALVKECVTRHPEGMSDEDRLVVEDLLRNPLIRPSIAAEGADASSHVGLFDLYPDEAYGALKELLQCLEHIAARASTMKLPVQLDRGADHL